LTNIKCRLEWRWRSKSRVVENSGCGKATAG